MSPGAVAQAVRGGIGRRRGIQTIVIALVLVVSTASSVLGLALIVDSNATFDHAFSAQRGAHVVARVDTSRATGAQLAATARLPQVTAAAGPFAEADVAGTDSSPGAPVEMLPPLTLAGRTTPGGPVDDVTLEDGHWPQRAGQIVMETNNDGFGAGIGDTVTVTSAPGRPRLTVVGLATSVSRTADGWVLPAEIPALRSSGAPATAEMLYRFRSAGSAAAVSADTAAVTRALPPRAVTDTQSYLGVRAAQKNQVAVYSPFVIAFAIIGLIMSVLIVSNVVSGAVIAGYYRIGILKSIGFTPGQVIAAYTGQVIVPAVGGCVGGVALGNLLSMSVLHKAADVYSVGRLGVPLWVNVIVPLAMCGLVALAAVIPAMRAGRLSATQALAAGRAPRTGRGYRAHRVFGRLALPRPVTIGLASPFGRPARMAATLAAVLLGVTAVTFAVGLVTTIRRAVADLDLTKTEQVQVYFNGPGPFTPKRPAPIQPSAAQPQRVITSALASLPGTTHYVLEEDDQYVRVSGLVQPVPVTAFIGDARWAGYAMSSGHWYTGPDQAVVPKRFLTTLHAHVGDTVTITGTGGRAVPVRIVGEVFAQEHDGLTMLTDWRTLTDADPGLTPSPTNAQYDVGLRPGTNPTAYVRALAPKLGPGYGFSLNQDDGAATAIALAGTLTLLLAIAAGLGVLNTVVLHTRERVHDLGVFKAVGMTPRQTVAMVLCSVAGTGLLAGVLAVPAGIIVHQNVIPAMAGAAGLGVPSSLQNVYGAGELVALALAGLAIALAGALLPAGWAAQSRTASALRTE
ncbi:MAG: ABC transporter permease [Solirubrobacteraceae bacterium]